MRPAANLRHYSAMFRRRGGIIVLALALSVGGALYPLAARPPQYQAEASALVSPVGIAGTAFADARLTAVQRLYRQTMLNDIIHLVRSRTISERVAEQVGDLSAAELARRVAVRNVPGTDFLIIRAMDAQPERAALIANTMAQEVVGFWAQISQFGATRARMFIEEQLRLAQDRRAATEQAALEFQARTGALALPDDVSRTTQRILDMQAAADAATLEETTAQARVNAIRSHLAAQNDTKLASLSIATNPVVAQIRDHLTGLELQLADLRQVYTDQHPAVKALLGKIGADRARLGEEATKAVGDTSLGMSPARAQFVRDMVDGEVDMATAAARATAIRAILGNLQARMGNVSGDALALARLQREAQDAERMVTGISALRQEAVMRESQAVASGQSAIVIVDRAIVPSRPITLPFPQTGALAGLLGLCLGAVLALAAEEMEKRIRPSRCPETVPGASEPALIPALSARLGFRPLAIALGMGTVLVPVLLALLALALVAPAGIVASGAQGGRVPVDLADASRALAQAVHAVFGTSVAQVRAMPDHVARFGQALIHAFWAAQ